MHNSCWLDTGGGRLAQMPGKKPQEYRGLRFTVAPDDRLHRVLHWPFYFESTNYSFLIKVERVSAEDPNDPWPNNLITRVVILESRDHQANAFPVPALAIGEKTTIMWEQIYIAHPGQTKLGIVTQPGSPNVDAQVLELFSYRVRPEEAIWLSAAIAIFAVLSLFAAIFVPIIVASLDDPPTVNIVVPTAEATPTPEPTMIVPTPTPQPTLDTADPPPQ